MDLLRTLGALVGAFLLFAIAVVLRRVWRARGDRLVACPATGEPAAVQMSAASALLHPGAPLHLKECSNWPEREGCGQECLRQIENAPDGCRVRSLLEAWYHEHPCVYCGREFEHLNWATHMPALMDSEQVTTQCSELDTERLPDLLQSHQAVCWDCHITETLIRKHPDLVVIRPGPWKRHSSGHTER